MHFSTLKIFDAPVVDYTMETPSGSSSILWQSTQISSFTALNSLIARDDRINFKRRESIMVGGCWLSSRFVITVHLSHELFNGNAFV